MYIRIDNLNGIDFKWKYKKKPKLRLNTTLKLDICTNCYILSEDFWDISNQVQAHK
jgi:hypothetical protein